MLVLVVLLIDSGQGLVVALLLLLPSLLVLPQFVDLVFIQWMRDDRKESKRIDRNAERAGAMGQPDELAKYNQYLAELARQDNPDI